MALYRGNRSPARCLLPRGAILKGTAFVAVWSAALFAPAAAQTVSVGKATAKLDKPFALAVTGGSCESDGKGNVGAVFGNALAFNIGPATVGMPGISKAPYKGPGTYRKVIITGYPDKKVLFAGLGTVVVDADRQKGTFATDDGKASGSWNCGVPLE
ncbi:MAG TPA: hypothetical protein VE993_19805 [Stellaceae bacterium]|nr:hypothetical protein [Stellaceae bacterium]